MDNEKCKCHKLKANNKAKITLADIINRLMAAIGWTYVVYRAMPILTDLIYKLVRQIEKYKNLIWRNKNGRRI